MNILKTQTIALFFTFLVFSPGSGFAASLFKGGDVIWEAGNNVFFKYADQGKTSFSKNDHPVELNAKEISTVLGSLKIRGYEQSLSDEKLKAVFTGKQSNMLGQYLAKGLKNAKPDQDIIFAVENSDSRLLGLKSDRFFVAGRAFYKINKLNVIIGDYDRPRDEGYEAAYDPTHVGIVHYQFDHGSRAKTSKGFKQAIAKVDGVEKTQRDNWLVIDVQAASEADAHKTKMRKQEETTKKRKELKEILGNEGTGRPKKATPSLEERFTTL